MRLTVKVLNLIVQTPGVAQVMVDMKPVGRILVGKDGTLEKEVNYLCGNSFVTDIVLSDAEL